MSEAIRTIEYISRPIELFKKHWTSLQKAIFAKIDGFTRSDDKARSYFALSDLKNEFRISTRQASRALKFLFDEDVIEREYSARSACSKYRVKTHIGEKCYIYTAQFLYEREFTFVYDDRTFTRPLRKIEVDMFSLIAAHKNFEFEATVRGFAALLGCAKSTAQAAIDGLMHCGLLTRPEEDKAKSRLKKSTYHADGALAREMKKVVSEARKKAQEKRKAEQAKLKATLKTQAQAETPNLPKSVIDANAKSDRERYYSLLRAEAERPVEIVKNRLLQIPEYKQAAKEFNGLELPLARAELAKDWQELRRLKDRKGELRALMKRIMQDIGYTDEDLKAKYRCQKCSDTGHKKNGRACDCYPKGGET